MLLKEDPILAPGPDAINVGVGSAPSNGAPQAFFVAVSVHVGGRVIRAWMTPDEARAVGCGLIGTAALVPLAGQSAPRPVLRPLDGGRKA